MAQVMAFGALDVHVSSTIAASIELGSGELRWQRMAGGIEPALAWCRALPRPARVTYEAGPTGFGLA